MTAAGEGAPQVTRGVPAPVWEAVYRADPNAVVSQSPAWRDAVMADGRYADTSLLYEFGSGTRVVLPLARRRHAPAWGAETASWPGHWGIGGPLIEGGTLPRHEAAAVLEDVTHRGLLAVEMQLRHAPGGDWLPLAQARGFRAESHGCHVLDISAGFGEVWERRFAGTARTAVRKAEKSGVEVEADQSGRLAPVFSDLYDKSIQRWAERQHEPLWLARWRTTRATTPGMLAAMSEKFGKDFTIWVARKDGVAVASILVVRAGDHAKYWRGAMDSELANKLRANDLLHRRAVEWACQEGCRSYDMGHTRPGSSLARFKEKLGAVPYCNHTLRAERLPLQSSARLVRTWAKKAIGFRDP